MSLDTYNRIMAVIAETIRTTIGEDWIEDFDIGPQTRFTVDLDMESIEFVKVADALQGHFGADIDIIGWLSGKSLPELIQLNVGDIAGYIAANEPAS